MKKKRKKVKRLTLLFLSGFLMSFMLVAGILSAAAALFSQAEAGLGNQTGDTSEGINSFPAEVERYRNAVTLYCGQYQIEGYENLVLCVMFRESGGQGNDPMASSESGYNTRFPREPLSIKDPLYSIDCGVHTLADAITAAGCTSPADFDHIALALQGYNFGNGYIQWAVDRDGGYTQENAQAFSDMMKAKLGWEVYGNPGYAQVILADYRAILYGGDNGIILPGTDQGISVVYFNQGDPAYQNGRFGNDVAISGCGPTSLAICVSSLSGTLIDPLEMCDWCYEKGVWIPGEGGLHSLPPTVCAEFGLSCKLTDGSNPQTLINALSSGKLIVTLVGPGHFTTSGHFLVLRGVTSTGKILVADCGNSANNNVEWDMSIILDEGRPLFWIIGEQ